MVILTEGNVSEIAEVLDKYFPLSVDHNTIEQFVLSVVEMEKRRA